MHRFPVVRAVWMASCLVVLPSLSGMSSPTHPEEGPSPKQIESLVDKLGSSKFAEREAATKELRRLGYGALDLLYPLLPNPDPEVRRRLSAIIADIEASIRAQHLLRTFAGHQHRVNHVTFTPDGQKALSASWDGTLCLWELTNEQPLRQLTGHPRAIHCTAVSPDGCFALSGSFDRTMRLWDLDSGKELRQFAGHEHEVWEVAFSPNGKQPLSACADGMVRLWDVDSGKEIRRLVGHAARVWSAAYSPDGRQVVSAGGSVLHNLRYGTDQKPDFAIRLWETDTGKEIRRFEGHTSDVRRVTFSPDGNRILSASFDSSVRLWDVKTGKELQRLVGHEGFVETAKFTPDGRHALSCEGGTLKGGILQLEPDPTRPTDHTIRFWNLDTGKEVIRFKGHSGPILSLAVAPNGNQFLTGGHDRVMHLWKMPATNPTALRAK